MKIKTQIIASLLALGVATAAFGQGTVTFFTFNANAAKGQVYLNGTTTDVTPGTSFDGQLWFSDTSATAGFYAASSVDLFTAGGNGSLINDSNPVIDPNQYGGNKFWYILAVWNASAGSTWTAATGLSTVTGSISPLSGASPTLTQWGVSATVTSTTGGDDGQGNGDPPVTPPTSNNFADFALHAIPEPSLMALGGLGAAALLLFRRRK